MFKTYVSTIQGSYEYFIIEKKIYKHERCLVKFKMCHSKWYHKICDQTFPYTFIVAAIFDEKIEHFGVNPLMYTF